MNDLPPPPPPPPQHPQPFLLSYDRAAAAAARWRRWILWLTVLLALASAWPWAVRSVRWAQRIYWRQQCLNWQNPSTQPVVQWKDGKATIATTASPWPRYYESLNQATLGGAGLLYLHRRAAQADKPRLVVIEVAAGTTAGQWRLWPRVIALDQGGRELDAPPPYYLEADKLYPALSDINHPAMIRLPFERGGGNHILTIWLDATDQLRYAE